jgi:hypothetical protein
MADPIVEKEFEKLNKGAEKFISDAQKQLAKLKKDQEKSADDEDIKGNKAQKIIVLEQAISYAKDIEKATTEVTNPALQKQQIGVAITYLIRQLEFLEIISKVGTVSKRFEGLSATGKILKEYLDKIAKTGESYKAWTEKGGTNAQDNEALNKQTIAILHYEADRFIKASSEKQKEVVDQSQAFLTSTKKAVGKKAKGDILDDAITYVDLIRTKTEAIIQENNRYTNMHVPKNVGEKLKTDIMQIVDYYVEAKNIPHSGWKGTLYSKPPLSKTAQTLEAFIDKLQVILPSLKKEIDLRLTKGANEPQEPSKTSKI